MTYIPKRLAEICEIANVNPKRTYDRVSELRKALGLQIVALKKRDPKAYRLKEKERIRRYRAQVL